MSGTSGWTTSAETRFGKQLCSVDVIAVVAVYLTRTLNHAHDRLVRTVDAVGVGRSSSLASFTTVKCERLYVNAGVDTSVDSQQSC